MYGEERYSGEFIQTRAPGFHLQVYVYLCVYLYLYELQINLPGVQLFSNTVYNVERIRRSMYRYLRKYVCIYITGVYHHGVIKFDQFV